MRDQSNTDPNNDDDDDSNNNNSVASILDELATDRQLNNKKKNANSIADMIGVNVNKKKTKKKKANNQLTPAPTPATTQVDDLTIFAGLNECLLGHLPQRTRKKSRRKKKQTRRKTLEDSNGFDYTSTSKVLEDYVMGNDEDDDDDNNNNYDDGNQDDDEYVSEAYDFLFDDDNGADDGDDIMDVHRTLQEGWNRDGVCFFFQYCL